MNRLEIVEIANDLTSAISASWYYAGSPLVHRPDLVISLKDIILGILLKKLTGK